MSIHVHLESFEGPLGLLLHLIRQEEMDIFNINIHQITRQYLDYIKAMRKLDLEVAGEFVAMAATLIHIKSRLLLPQYDSDGEVIEGEDPRRELVQKLLEYQKIQGLAKQLYQRALLGRDVWARGHRENFVNPSDSEIIMEDNALFALIKAYRFVVKNMKNSVHRVVGGLQSIAERILEMRHLLVVGKRMEFRELVRGPKETARGRVLVTFLSLLELAKMGFVALFQSDVQAEIFVETKEAIDRDVVARVEEYDQTQAEQKAEQIFQQAEMDFVEEAEAKAKAEAETERNAVAEAIVHDGADLGMVGNSSTNMSSITTTGLETVASSDSLSHDLSELSEDLSNTLPDVSISSSDLGALSPLDPVLAGDFASMDLDPLSPHEQFVKAATDEEIAAEEQRLDLLDQEGTNS